MFNEADVKVYAGTKQPAPEIGQHNIAERADGNRAHETDDHCRPDTTPIPAVQSCAHNGAQYDVQRVQRMKHNVLDMGREPDGNHQRHDGYPAEGAKGGKGHMSLQLVGDICKLTRLP